MAAQAELPPYTIVSPVKDEAEHFARTAESIIGQTHRPVQWMIVDDGSSDETPQIAARYADEHDWITVLRREPGAVRARGAPIVHAFRAGMDALETPGDIVVKLDGDLFLPAHYFAWVCDAFRRSPRAGVISGLALIHNDRYWTLDTVNPMTANGVAKAYRMTCFEDIGGLHAAMGWDGIDEYAARARGWEVHVLSELQILHYRRRGSKQRWWRARWEEGRGAHYMGYLAAFVGVRVAYRMMVERPPVLGGLVLGAGYLWQRVTRGEQVPDPRAIEQLRTDQRARLRATARLQPGVVRRDMAVGPAYTMTGIEPHAAQHEAAPEFSSR